MPQPRRLAAAPVPAVALVLALAAAAASQAEALEVPVRLGEHDGFERVVFDWPDDVAFSLERDEDGLAVVFADGARFRLASPRDAGGDRLTGLSLPARPDARRILLSPDPTTPARSFSLADNRVVIDLFPKSVETGERAPRPAAAAAPDDAGAAAAAEDEAAADAVDLEAELYRRDLMIASMLRRLERVERSLPLPAAEPFADGTGGGTPSVLAPDAGPAAANAAEVASAAEASAGAPATDAEGNVIDPDRVARALERSLTRDGALLLPAGRAEIEPGLRYQRSSETGPVFVSNGDPLVVFVGEDEVERDLVVASLDLRLGLPFDSQLELHLPYRYVDQRERTMVGGQLAAGESGSGQGLGDLRLGLAKTLTREEGWWPDLVGRVSWDSATGRTRDSGVALGGGFHELGASLAAVKRQDPLAFVGSLDLETTLEEDEVEPGDVFGFSLGAILAASPRTSLRVSVAQQFAGEARVAGDDIDGSDLRTATLTIGAASVLGVDTLLDLALDVGLSEDAPDYALRLAVPVRFSLPFP